MGTKILPLWTGDGDDFVFVSSDSWPGAGGTLGRTKAQIEEAKAQGIKPAGGAGFGYLGAPDGAMIEFAGNSKPSFSIMSTCIRTIRCARCSGIRST